MEDEDDNRGEKEGGVVGSHEEHTNQDIANEEEKSKNEGYSGEEKESEIEDMVGEQVDDSIEEEDNSKSEDEDQEKASESECMDEENEEENENMSEESEGSMTIGNTVIALSEEASREKRTKEPGPLLTPFTGDEEASSNKDDLPLSEVGKKPKKTHVKATKSIVPIRKEMAIPAKTHLAMSKIKVVDEQIIKESRGAKKPMKQVSIVKHVIELDREDKSESGLLEKSSTQNRKVAKATKTTTPSVDMGEPDEENVFADIDEYIEDTNTIVPPRVDAASFKVEHNLILMLKAEGFFQNSTDDDPTQHLKILLGVYAMNMQNNISDDALRLRVFKKSSTREARQWIQIIPPNYIYTWPELVRAFLAKGFPQNKNFELQDKIFFFKQLLGEHLHEA
uniref:Nucleolin-like n=1 Tax=Nicotiana tabacum TaxID=4097 RepID=A0A1S3X5H5_TOBAC|nr:PREDICTED: nucleolin-like [Nicotiana tabacum]